MGIFKDRTEFINGAISRTQAQDEKRLLAVGFIPKFLEKEYSEFMVGREIGTDNDIDKISNQNYFALNPDKVGGKTVAGTGFLNPILVKGTMQDALTAIDITLNTTEPVKNEGEPQAKKQDSIESNKEVKTKESKPMAKQNTTNEIKPEIEVSSKDLQIIKKDKLTGDSTNGKKYQNTSETIRKYNPNLSTDEIKAWVYHKRKFGNPMKGWEEFFIGGGTNSNILLQTTRDTTVKDNKYVDLRTIPANTIIGAKTKFRNTYGTETLVIAKTVQGELLWVNIADVKEIKNMTGESQSEIDRLVKAKALIFDGNEYYPYPVYLFGNIYEKIVTLNTEANKKQIIDQYGEEFFNEQLAKVKTYLPKQKSFRDPVRSNRPHILALSEFANDPAKFGVKELNEETGIKLGETKRGRFIEVDEKISLFDAFKYWFEEFVKDTELKNTTKANIRNYYFAKAVKWPKDEDGKDLLTNAQKDELTGNARLAAEELFSDFLSTALLFEDAVALDNIWNEMYNAFTNVIQFVDQIPIGFEGSTMFKDGQLDVKPAQRQGLAYLQLTGSGCLAYDVGFGKTLTGVLNVAQLLSQGLIKRPLIVVPKPTYKNWLRELFGYWKKGERIESYQFDGATYYYGVFSGSKVKVNDWYNLSGKHFEKVLAANGGDLNKMVPENTITILSYKGFEQMGFSRDVSGDMFDSIARVIMQKDAREGEEKSAKSSEKEAASFYQKVQGWLGLGNKNAVVAVDKCGFDHVTVDEAHNFKNVFSSCGKDPATGRKLFNISAGQSTRAVKMFFITNYIQAKFGKRVTLLTATPFTNSPLEMYSMLSFIGLESLNQYKLFNIKKFFEQFILETIEYAIDAKGEIITKPVIKSFKNVKLLQTILYNHFHYKDNPKEAGVVRPCRIDLPRPGITTYLEMNEWQKKNQAAIKLIAKQVSRENPGAVLKAMNQSLNNAFSPFAFKYGEENIQPESAKDFVDQSPKIKYACLCVKSIKEWHEQRGEECSGIILYSNRGAEWFEYIKDYLIDELKFKRKIKYGDDADGEEVSEVEIITGGGGEGAEDRKELIKDAFNAGTVKVIIGTSTIREGINLQSRSAVTIDLYPEWNPTDITQLKGRNWRQGNMYGYVRFVMPLVINSMDNFINQKLDEKSKRIANLWAQVGDDNNTITNESELDPEEIKYALVEDAGEKFKMKYATIKAEMQRTFDILNENKETMANITYNISELKGNEERLYDKYNNNKTSWIELAGYFKKLDLKKLKEDGLADKTVKNIELVSKNVNELIEAFNKYTANRPHIPDLLEISRMLRSRNFDVFTDASSLGTQIGREIKNITGWNTFDDNKWLYDRVVSSYSAVAKAQKSILNAYGKSWHDDLSSIVDDINKRIEEIKLSAEMVQSDEYQKQMIAEIEAEMEQARAIRGDLHEQVDKFAQLNHLLSYLSDNTDKENCPIPEAPCCPSTKITVVHQDKNHETPIGTVSVEAEGEMDVNSPEIQQMLRDAIATITEVMPDLSKADQKEAKEALAICKELLIDQNPPPSGGKKKESKKEDKRSNKQKFDDLVAEKHDWGTLRDFIPSHQLSVIASGVKGEEGDYFIEQLERIRDIISKTPKTYETEGQEQKQFYLHYFTSSSDWYILERDMEKEQKQAFGYTILNGDRMNAEYGYIDLTYLLKTNKVELDMHFDPTDVNTITEGGLKSEGEIKPYNVKWQTHDVNGNYAQVRNETFYAKSPKEAWKQAYMEGEHENDYLLSIDGRRPSFYGIEERSDIKYKDEPGQNDKFEEPGNEVSVEFTYSKELTDEEKAKIGKVGLWYDDDGLSIFLGNDKGISEKQMLKLFEEKVVGKENYKKHFGRILPPRKDEMRRGGPINKTEQLKRKEYKWDQGKNEYLITWFIPVKNEEDIEGEDTLRADNDTEAIDKFKNRRKRAQINTFSNQGLYQMKKGGPVEKKVKVAYYNYGEFSENREIELIDLPDNLLTKDELSGFIIRPEDQNKYFYAGDNDLLDYAEGMGIKNAYAVSKPYPPQFKKGGPIVSGYEDLSKKKADVVYDSKVHEVPEVELSKVGVVEFEGDIKIGGSEDAAKALKQFWDYSQVNIAEHFNVLLLNRQNKVIGFYSHSKGGVDSTVADTELIAAVVIKSLARGVIVCHNHPSGNLKPSDADIQITKKLKEALNLLNVSLLDSLIIVPNGSYYSLADQGQMRTGGPVGDQTIYRYEGKDYTAQELIDFADSAAEYDRRDNAEFGEEGEHIETIDQAVLYLGDDDVEVISGSELEQGISIEEEHRKTLEKLAKGEITVDQAVKETAQVHLKENPNYYSDLQSVEGGNMRKGGPVRPKFAVNKDRKYFNKNQEHEIRYAKETGRKKVRYQLRKGGPVEQRVCPEGTLIQTLIFSKDNFTKNEAQKWSDKHDFNTSYVDEKDKTYRIRQRHPDNFKDDSFRTIIIRKGVKAVIGCPKE